MCGVVGYPAASGAAAELMQTQVRAMASALVHRGPDSPGDWVDAEAGIALAHRRLAIVVLTAAGHQPMVSPSGRFVVSDNGEIYNHLDLRAALEERGNTLMWRGSFDPCRDRGAATRRDRDTIARGRSRLGGLKPCCVPRVCGARAGSTRR